MKALLIRRTPQLMVVLLMAALCLSSAAYAQGADDPDSTAADTTGSLDVSSDSLDTDSDSLDADSDSLDADSDSLDADSDSLDTDSDSLDVSSDSLDADSDSLDADSDSLDADSDSLDADSDSLDVSSDSLDADSDSLDVSSDSLDADSDSLDVSSDSLDVSSDSLDADSDSLDVSSDSLDADSDSLDVSSDSLDADSDSLDVSSDSLDADSDSLDVSSDSLDADSDSLDADSDSLDADSDSLDVSSDSLDADSDSLDVSSDSLASGDGESALKGDYDGDGKVGVMDLLDMLKVFGNGAASGSLEYDLNDDGKVNVFDLLEMLYQFSAKNKGITKKVAPAGSSNVGDRGKGVRSGVSGTGLASAGTKLAFPDGSVLNVADGFNGTSLAGVAASGGLAGELLGVVEAGLSVGAPVTLPRAFTLGQNYPNPFNPSTTIQYEIGEGQSVFTRLTVHNIRGQVVRTLVNSLKQAGSFQVQWDGLDEAGRRVSSGLYFYRIVAGEYAQTRKMVLLK